MRLAGQTAETAGTHLQNVWETLRVNLGQDCEGEQTRQTCCLNEGGF